MRRWISGAVLAYVLYGLFIYLYIFQSGDSSVPDSVKGTPADPATFMTGRELILSEEYSKIRNFLFFIKIPFDWLVFFILLVAGFSKKIKSVLERATRFSYLRIAGYVFVLSVVVALCSLPLDWISYQIALNYDISAQSTGSWIKDQVIDFWISFPLMTLVTIVFYALLKKSEKRWWLYAWLITVPFTLFLFFLQPVVIDPLYNDFYPLKDQELKADILALADEAKIPADQVYEVNMSEKTNTLNAYVTGLGNNKRIVLWDTTLKELDKPEILFIMAHEMGHYVMKHVYYGLGGYLLMSLLGLYFIDKIYRWLASRYRTMLNIEGKHDLAALPLLLAIVAILSFLSSPLNNTVSRFMERQADQYAIELTEDKEAGIKTFQELSIAGLSQTNPPALVKFFRYGHPTIMERIQSLDNYKKAEDRE
ncbi:M48 family metallopeptidase [Bacillus gobiensis]|uniref:M48 family metallopeptidase n=1 Tax=Bacillus gobiensis TaxID=1441095 RepID=UPI003D1F98A4